MTETYEQIPHQFRNLGSNRSLDRKCRDTVSNSPTNVVFASIYVYGQEGLTLVDPYSRYVAGSWGRKPNRIEID